MSEVYPWEIVRRLANQHLTEPRCERRATIDDGLRRETEEDEAADEGTEETDEEPR